MVESKRSRERIDRHGHRDFTVRGEAVRNGCWEVDKISGEGGLGVRLSGPVELCTQDTSVNAVVTRRSGRHTHPIVSTLQVPL